MGDLNRAYNELHIILRTRYEERAMLNFYKHWACDVPSIGARVFAMAFQNNLPDLTILDAKYMNHLVLHITTSILLIF
jgi:hypothetical protein